MTSSWCVTLRGIGVKPRHGPCPVFAAPALPREGVSATCAYDGSDLIAVRTATKLSSMRLVHLTRDFPPAANGGLSRAVGNLVQAQRRRGLEPWVVSFDGWRPQRGTAASGQGDAEVREEKGVAIVRLRGSGQLDAAIGAINAARPTVAHVHDAMLWALSERLRAVPRLYSAHVLHFHMRRLRGLGMPTHSEAAEARALAEADAIIAPAPSVAELLVSAAGVAPSRVQVVGATPKPHPVCARVHASCAPPRVLYAGRFSDIKGTWDLLQAVPQVLEQHPTAHFVIAGGLPEAPKRDRRWRRRLKGWLAPAAAHHLELVGWCDATELARLYRQASVFVAPSRFETFGQSALEAMRHGLPIAASNAGGLGDLLTDEQTALLSPPGDISALARNIGRLIAQPELAARLGEQARQASQREHPWQQSVDALTRIYQRIAPQAAGRRGD